MQLESNVYQHSEQKDFLLEKAASEISLKKQFGILRNSKNTGCGEVAVS